MPDNAGTGGEFYVTGLGIVVDDPDMWSRVAELATYELLERYVLFELQVSEARRHGYGRRILAFHEEMVSRPIGVGRRDRSSFSSGSL